MAKKISHNQIERILLIIIPVCLFTTGIYAYSQLYNGNVLGTQTKQIVTSNTQLQSIAINKYKEGNLPLGDGKYITTGAKKGYVYLCNVMKDQGGAQANVPWIHGNTWNYKEKSSIAGKISWKNAQFTNTISGSTRTLSGNDLPINHTTGKYPVSSTDPAYKYDKNPNTISAQTLALSLPVNPTYSSIPYCMGGEVGVMTTGVALFNGFDAGLRDAVAHEVQDSCSGHPQVSGEYHYHGLSSCITDVGVSTVIGFALDGFPITGPKIATDKYLTTDNLDECHGLTSEIVLDGKKKTMYHYVMTQDFPYSASCFRGKPVSYQIAKAAKSTTQQEGNGSLQNTQTQGGTSQPKPPQEAITFCKGKASGTSCSFSAPNGTASGTCQVPPGQTTIICVPANGRPQ